MDEARSTVMRAVKSRDTQPELAVRRRLHAAGFRYRLCRKDLPGTPDIVLSRLKTAVFVHGCFWHWHGCKRCRMPKSNEDYWSSKIARNVKRDRIAVQRLKELGWRTVVIWECDLADGTEKLLTQLTFLENKAKPTTSDPFVS